MIPLPSRHFSVVLILTLAAGSAWGGASDLLTDASAALNEGVPQVAIVKLQQQLADASKLEPGDRRLVKARLAEAFLVAGRATDALGLIHDPDLKEPMLEARIDAATGRWKEALAIYSAPAAPGQPQTVISRAECLWQLGRLSDAVTTLENAGAEAPAAVQLRLAEFYLEQNSLKACSRLLQGIKPHTLAEQKWKQYVEARLYLEQGYPAYAYGRFEEILRDPRQLTENLVAGSALGMTQARAELSGLADADDILEQFIWKYPESPHLDTVFRKLDEVYAGEENASKSELEKWSGRNEVQRAGYAEYYLAKLLLREGKEEQALNTLQGFSVRFPRHSILADALLM